MGSDPRRPIVSIAIFWLFLLLCLLDFGLGRFAGRAPLEQQTQAYLSDLHVSLGITAAILLAAQFLLGVGLRLAVRGAKPHDARAVVALWLRLLIYLSFLTLAVSGVLAMACRGEHVFFFEYGLPFWDAGERALAEPLQTIHGFSAPTLAGLILAYVAFAIFDRLMPASRPADVAAEPATPTTIASIIAHDLAHSFRFFGVTAFWIELFLGVVSAPLLIFSYVGHTVSPSVSGFGDAINWATAGLALLVLSILFGYRYMNVAIRIKSQPEYYLAHERSMSFWFVALGGFINGLGTLVSFLGVGLSVALLIGKTVSQPPGIAITDPNRIIRALDIFVLLVNFSLLFAHFIGVGVAAWLSISGLKARHQYVVATEARKPGA